MTGDVTANVFIEKTGMGTTLKGIVSSGSIGNGIQLDTVTNAVITRNRIKGGDYGIVLNACPNSRTDYNVLHDQTTAGIYLAAGTAHAVYNNTVHNAGNGFLAGAAPSGSATVYVKNNLFLDCTNVMNVAAVDIDLDYNLGYGFTNWGAGGLDLATYQALGLDVHSTAENPLLTDPDNNDYTLTTSSPAKNTGTDVGLTVDYSGNPIVGAPDRGAFEFQEAA